MHITCWEINPRQAGNAGVVGDFVLKHSWGDTPEYQRIARELFPQAAYILAARDEGMNMVGVICLTRHWGCPDDHTDKRLWGVAKVVHPDYRKHGIGARLSRSALAWATANKLPGETHLYASVDSEKGRIYMENNGWQYISPGRNEDGSAMTVYRFPI